MSSLFPSSLKKRRDLLLSSSRRDMISSLVKNLSPEYDIPFNLNEGTEK